MGRAGLPGLCGAVPRRAASELRARLEAAARARSALDAALHGLERHGREEDAAAVEAAATAAEAAAPGGLLADDAARGREAARRARAAAAAEARLARALQEGAPAAALARLIQARLRAAAARGPLPDAGGSRPQTLWPSSCPNFKPAK